MEVEAEAEAQFWNRSGSGSRSGSYFLLPNGSGSGSGSTQPRASTSASASASTLDLHIMLMINKLNQNVQIKYEISAALFFGIISKFQWHENDLLVTRKSFTNWQVSHQIFDTNWCVIFHGGRQNGKEKKDAWIGHGNLGLPRQTHVCYRKIHICTTQMKNFLSSLLSLSFPL